MAAMACSSSPSHGSAVVNALEEVLQDPSFKISSPVAADALQAATTLLQWRQDAENEPVISAFLEKLVVDLSEPFTASSSGRRPLNREKLEGTLVSHLPVALLAAESLCVRGLVLFLPQFYTSTSLT